MVLPMDYEKLLKSVLNVYKVPQAHIDALEPLFWRTLVMTTPLIYIKNLMGMFHLESMLGVVAYILYFILFAGIIIFYTPFQVNSIRLAAHQKPSTSFSFMREPEYSFLKKLLWLGLILIGVGCLSLLPYATSRFLIQAGSTSNIFTTFSTFLLLAGVGATLYIAVRTIGILVITALGKNISIADFFQLTHGDAKAMAMIIFLSILPPLLVAQLIEFSLDTLIQASNSIIFQLFMGLIQSTVRAAAYLVSLYIVWVSLTQYMEKEKA